MKDLCIICMCILIHVSSVYAQEPTVSVVGFNFSECIEDVYPLVLKERMVSQNFKMDTLQIEITTTATCCMSFVPGSTFDNGILNLTYEEIGEGCECACNYQLIYKILGLKNQDFKVELNGTAITLSSEPYITNPIQFKIHHGDTINYFDKYGLKQGLFLMGDKEKPIVTVIYENNKPVERRRNIRYDKRGNKASKISMQNGKEWFNKYYSNGNLRKTCIIYEFSRSGSTYQDLYSCIQYDREGKSSEYLELKTQVDSIDNKNAYFLILFKDTNDYLVYTKFDDKLIPYKKVNTLEHNEMDTIYLMYEKGLPKETITRISNQLTDKHINYIKQYCFNRFGFLD